jgi:hypothetical protein
VVFIWDSYHDLTVAAITGRRFAPQLSLVGHNNPVGTPANINARIGFCFPGFSLHEEMALMVIGGLTPSESLRAATLNPAKFLGLDKTLGTIEPGKIADWCCSMPTRSQIFATRKKSMR